MSSEESDIFEVERVVGSKIYKGKRQYLIKWLGFPPEENTWENVDDMYCDKLIKEFEERKNKKTLGKTTNNVNTKEKKDTQLKRKATQKIPKNTTTHKINTPKHKTIPPTEDNMPIESPTPSPQKLSDSHKQSLNRIEKKYKLSPSRRVPNTYDSVVEKVQKIYFVENKKKVQVTYVDGSLGDIDYEIAKIGLPLHLIEYYETQTNLQ